MELNRIVTASLSSSPRIRVDIRLDTNVIECLLGVASEVLALSSRSIALFSDPPHSGDVECAGGAPVQHVVLGDIFFAHDVDNALLSGDVVSTPRARVPFLSPGVKDEEHRALERVVLLIEVQGRTRRNMDFGYGLLRRRRLVGLEHLHRVAERDGQSLECSTQVDRVCNLPTGSDRESCGVFVRLLLFRIRVVDPAHFLNPRSAEQVRVDGSIERFVARVVVDSRQERLDQCVPTLRLVSDVLIHIVAHISKAELELVGDLGLLVDAAGLIYP